MLERADEDSGLKRDEALLFWIEQYAPYGVITLDESFRVRTWNRWMEFYSGSVLDQVRGKNLFSLYPDLEQRRLTGHFERALQGQASVLSTALHRYLLPLRSPFREGGIDLMLQTARIAPLYSKGEICGIVLVIEDVTQREAQAEALSRQHRRDELLSWALAHLLKTDHPRKGVRQLFFKIAEHLDYDTFLIYLRDLETGKVRLEATGGLPIECETDLLECPFLSLFSDTAAGPVVLNYAEPGTAPLNEALRRARISGLIAIPLVANDRNLGLLCFASWSRNTIAPEEAELVKTIGQYLATALDRENADMQLRKAQQLLTDHAELLEKKVQERTARLRESVSELETFSYTIAHDLRAPARSMSGYCEVMLEDFSDVLPEEALGLVQRIARASHRMELLTRDLLEFSKVSRQEIILSPVEIEPIIDELTSMRLPSVRQSLTVSSPLHPVRAHRGLLQHVLLNLVDNAVKFVQPDTPPKITISTEVIEQGSAGMGRPFPAAQTLPPQRLTQAGNDEYVRIWVRDEGIGIPREAHQKIFGIFERASKSYEGTGIGLAIVARAMQRMGGACGVESEVGKGSQFWLELPAA